MPYQVTPEDLHKLIAFQTELGVAEPELSGLMDLTVGRSGGVSLCETAFPLRRRI